MFGIILTSRGCPARRRRPDLDRVILFPRPETTGPEDLEGPVASSLRGRRTEGEPTPDLRIFAPKARKSRKADIERARRLLATKLTYIAHPSFDDPSAHDAILAPSPGVEIPELDRTPVTHGPNMDFSRRTRLPSREQEAHQFRKMNYLKCLACRIRDRIDPDSPDRSDLDQIEQLQAEAVKLKNQIVETHLPLVCSFAKKFVRAGYDLSAQLLATIDLIELNEAFATQVLAVLDGWRWRDDARLNVNGSGISLGHPIGATGLRMTTTLLHELRRRGGGKGLVTMCIGGGQGLAATVETN